MYLPSLAMLSPSTKTKGEIELNGFNGDKIGMQQMMAVIRK